MADPGLPPKGRPRSLHLLESLVQEEEAKVQNRGGTNVVIPTETRESTESGSGSGDFYDTDKQQIKKGSSAKASYGEFKMKDMENDSKVLKGNPNAGFRGKKIRKQGKRSDSKERTQTTSKKVVRPFSADYNQNKRNKLNSNIRNGRPKTSKGRVQNIRTSSPKGQRSRSPPSYSSETYSSDEEYIKKKKYRSNSDHSLDQKAKKDNDSFFDSDEGLTQKNEQDNPPRNRSRSHSSDSSRSSSRSSDSDRGRRSNQKNKRRNSKNRSSSSSSSSSDRSSSHHRNSRSRSSSGDSSGRGKNGQHKRVNGHENSGKKKASVKTVYADRHGNQGTKNGDGQRMVVVEDYSTISDSDNETKKPAQEVTKPPMHPKKNKPLLSRKKREGYKIFQIDPDLYLESKLHQKYSELEELMTCSFVDQKSHMTRHHLYQMELLRDQYQNASHGLPSAATIIPRSLPGEIRNRSKRPGSAKRAQHGRHFDSDVESTSTYKNKSTGRIKQKKRSDDNAYGTIQSVMAAERARQTDKIRTDIIVERPCSAKKSTKKKKKIEASFKSKKSDTEEEISERPSFSSVSKTSSSPRTPRNGPSIDDHIKYSENEKLKKWLKEKDKIYRKHVKEERRKKREEREEMVKQANEKFVKRLESQKTVKKWMKEKSKEWVKIQKEKRQKEKEEDAWLESYRKTKSIPGDTLRIRPQSAPSERTDDTNEHLKEEIRAARDAEEEKKQSKRAQDGPHPPQTKFIYKRPVAGKIKLKMQVRGKSPVAKKTDSEDQPEPTEQEKAKQMRISYDDWVKKKRMDDAARKENAKRQRELAKSDPELERIIPALGRKRIEDKLNRRKRIDTGIKKFDKQTNRSFGGSEFDGEPIERPRSAYRLESDRDNADSPALTVKQLNRPSTAPSSRGRVPSPKKSVNSPRKAIIPQRADQIMENEDAANPFTLPFSPNKGIPPHVAERQRRIFADQITSNLTEIEQRALLNAELIQEGVSDADIAEYAQQSRLELDKPVTKINIETDNDDKEEQHPKITDIMYSPKKADSSDTSSDENEDLNKDNTETTNIAQPIGVSEEIKTVKTEESFQPLTATENMEEINDSSANEQQVDEKPESSNGHSHYKTYGNLNELNLEKPNTDAQQADNEDHLKEEIEKLKEKVEHLKVQPELPLKHAEESKVESEPTITIVTDSEKDPNLIGILKESKREDIPVPEVSEEPDQCARNNEDNDDDDEEPNSPREESGNYRKRVSFNEHTEVFQSFESTSTETVTPEPEEFDPKVEGLDAQQSFDAEDEDDDGDDRPAILKLQGEKMTINIGGMVLNPTVIDGEQADDIDKNDSKTEGTDEPLNVEEEKTSTFLTNPDEESNA